MDYLVELKKLPKNIQDILISPFGARINAEIAKQHGLDRDRADKLIDLVNDIYLKTISINSLLAEISRRLNLDPKKSAALAVEIAGKKLLIADDYFQGGAAAFLSASGTDPSNFAADVAAQKDAIEQEARTAEVPDIQLKDILADNLPDKEFFLKSREDILSLFKEDLVKILSLGPEFNDLISEVNDELFEFIDDEDYRRQLEGALYANNQEAITRVKPLIRGVSERATIANWLKDFIVFHGSENFNDIILAEYLVNSSSAKQLSAADKKKIKKLLKIYRNLAFFPDSFLDKDEGWGVIPLEIDYSTDKIGEEKKSAQGGVNVNISQPSFQDDPAKKNIVEKAVFPAPSAPRAINSEAFISSPAPSVRKDVQPLFSASESPASVKLSLAEELEIMLRDYPDGSLEYKTIEQELRRLRQKK